MSQRESGRVSLSVVRSTTLGGRSNETMYGRGRASIWPPSFISGLAAKPSTRTRMVAPRDISGRLDMNEQASEFFSGLRVARRAMPVPTPLPMLAVRRTGRFSRLHRLLSFFLARRRGQ
jgi:hypothetical protein